MNCALKGIGVQGPAAECPHSTRCGHELRQPFVQESGASVVRGLNSRAQTPTELASIEGNVIVRPANKATLLVVAAAAALGASASSAAPGDDIYARPGLIASAGDGARLNFTCLGQGSPAVVFDAGWSDWAA